jgi:hypothetical protein
VIEQRGQVVLDIAFISKTGPESLFERIAGQCLLTGFVQSVADPASRASMGRWLLLEKRVILFVRGGFMGGWTVADVAEAVKSGARVIFATTGPLPDELRPYSHTKFPPTPGSFLK